MRVGRRISTGFWEDTWVETLSPKERLAFIYLFSCPATTPAGLYKLSIRRMAFETGLSQDETTAALAKFEAASRILYDRETSVVWVRHFRRFHNSKAPNWLKGVAAAVSEIADCAPKRAYWEAWPIGTLPLPVPDEGDGSDPGQTIVTPGLTASDDVRRGQAGSDATCAGPGPRPRPRAGAGPGAGAGPMPSDLTDLPASADALPHQSESDRSHTGALAAFSEPELEAFWQAVEWREKADGGVLEEDELQQMMVWANEYGPGVLRDAARKTFKAAPRNPGGYLRTILKRQHEASGPDPP